MDLSFSSWNVFTLQYESLFPWAHLICVWNIDLVDKGQGSNKCVCVCVCVWERKRACGPVCSIHSMTWFFLSRYFYDLGRFGTELSLLLEHSADSFCLWKKKTKLHSETEKDLQSFLGHLSMVSAIEMIYASPPMQENQCLWQIPFPPLWISSFRSVASMVS